MNENSNISCPQCGHNFNVEEVLTHKLEVEFQNKLIAKQKEIEAIASRKEADLTKEKVLFEKQKSDIEIAAKKKLDEIEQLKFQNAKNLGLKEQELNQKILDQEKLISKGIEDEKVKLEKVIREKVREDSNREMNALKTELSDKQKQNNELRDSAIELEKLKMKFYAQEKEITYKLQQEFRKQAFEMEKIAVTRVQEEFDLKLRDKDKSLADQKKLIEELQRKSEQGSMQSQGEVQELAIENELKALFKYDEIDEVPKGKKGADCIQTVRNERLDECGKICYESKRTKAFSKDWVQKLKDDRQRVNADIAVLITEVLPDGIEKVGEYDGIWVCDYHNFKGLAMVLRDSLIRINTIREAQSKKGDKMHMLYDYLTGNEFRSRLDTIIDGFDDMRNSITKERAAMEKLWSQREKMLDRVIISTSAMYGEIRGIAGSSVPDFPKLESNKELKLIE